MAPLGSLMAEVIRGLYNRPWRTGDAPLRIKPWAGQRWSSKGLISLGKNGAA